MAATTTTTQYPCLHALSTSVCLSVEKLLETTDAEFRDLSKEIEGNTALQHAQLWLERKAVPVSQKKSDHGWETYSLHDLCHECDATMKELLKLSQGDFVRLSLEIVQNRVRCHGRIAKEWNQRKQQQEDDDDDDDDDDGSLSTQPEVEIRVKREQTETPPPDDDDEQIEIQVGERYFVKYYDGIEYPVIVTNVLVPKSGEKQECDVWYEDYSKRDQSRVEVSSLEPVTRKRERIYKEMQRMRQEVEAKKKMKKAQTKKKRKKQTVTSTRVTQRKRKQEVEEEKQNNKPAENKRSRVVLTKKQEKDEKELGPPTSIDNLPPYQDRLPGELQIQKGRYQRRVYFCINDDTPMSISHKFNVPVSKIVYDNEQSYPKLTQRSRFMDWTRIVLPLAKSRKGRTIG